MNRWLSKNILKIISYFLLIGPFFDLVTSLSIHVFKIPFNFIIIFKILFMAILMYYTLFVSNNKHKKKLWIYYSLLGVYFIVTTIMILINKDSSVLVYELSSVIRTFFAPICLIGIYIVYIDKESKIDNRILAISFLEYFILLVIPTITHIGFDSYAYSKVGSVGWFNSANEIGGIISILLPILLYQLYKDKKLFLSILFLIPLLYVIVSVGSKVPVITTLMTLCLFAILYLKDNPKYLKFTIIPFILMISLAIYIIPKTNFYKNIQIHLDFLEVKSITDLMDIEKIDHFVFSSRLKFLNQTRTNFKKSDISSQLIGIGYIENYATDEVNVKTIEMDYFDIFYRNGIVGFILFFMPIIWILLNLKLDKKIEVYSLFLAILLAFFQGHILVAPSVSIFVIIIFLNGGKHEKLLRNS